MVVKMMLQEVKKGGSVRLLSMGEDDVGVRWREYFIQLLNVDVIGEVGRRGLHEIRV